MTVDIKAGGKDRPFRLGYKAMKELAVEESNNPDLTKKNMGLDYAELQFFLGFKYGAITHGIEVDFTKEDIVDWIDKDFTLLDKMTKAAESMMPDNKEVEGKKKGG